MKRLFCLLVSLLFLCTPLAACQQKPSDELRLPSETEPPTELPAEPDLTLQEDELAVYFNGTTLQCVSAEGTEFSYSIEQESEIRLNDYSLIDTGYLPEEDQPACRTFEGEQEKIACLQLIFGNLKRGLRFEKLADAQPSGAIDLSLVLKTSDDEIHLFNTFFDQRLTLFWQSNGIGERYISEPVDLSSFYQTYFPSHWLDSIANSTDEIEIGFDGERFWCGIPMQTPYFECSLDEMRLVCSLGAVSSFSSAVVTDREDLSEFFGLLFSDTTVYRLMRREKENWNYYMVFGPRFYMNHKETSNVYRSSLYDGNVNQRGLALTLRGENTIVFRTPTADYVAEISDTSEQLSKFFYNYHDPNLNG